MASRSRRTIDIPPFPTLHWREFSWVGLGRLDSWSGFQTRRGTYGARSSEDGSDGAVELNIIPPEDSSDQPPTAEQARAFEYLLENEEAVRDAVLRAIVEYAATMREDQTRDTEAHRAMARERGWELSSDDEDGIPRIERPDELREHIGLSSVHVMPLARDGMTCVGFEFSCEWEEEHGLGVLTHQGRVLEVGGADTAFTDPFVDEDQE